MEPLDFSNRNEELLNCMPHFMENQTLKIPNEEILGLSNHNVTQTVVYPQMFPTSTHDKMIEVPASTTQTSYSNNSTTNSFSAALQSPKKEKNCTTLTAQQLRLLRETPEEREKRLIAGRERMRLYRQKEREVESMEQKERRLAVARERTRLGRMMETAEQREKRLRKSRERLRMKRQQESSEERDKRLKLHRDSKRERYRRMTPEQRTHCRTPTRRSSDTTEEQKKQVAMVVTTDGNIYNNSPLMCDVKTEPQEEFQSAAVLKTNLESSIPVSIADNADHLLPNIIKNSSCNVKEQPLYYIESSVITDSTMSDQNNCWQKNIVTYAPNNLYSNLPSVNPEELQPIAPLSCESYVIGYSQNMKSSEDSMPECIQSNGLIYTMASSTDVITSHPQM